MNVLYPAIIKKEDNGYFVQFIDFDEAITEGGTEEEALFNASEVLTLTIEGRAEEGLEIPRPSKSSKGTIQVSPAARVQAALLVRWVKKNSDQKTADLARALSTSWPAIARLEDPHHSPNLKQLEKIAAALGQQLIISMEPIHLSAV